MRDRRNGPAWLQKLSRINGALMFAVLSLTVIGIFFIYSAVYVREDLPLTSLFMRQFAWGLSGVGLCLGIALLDYRRICRWAWGLYGISLLLLALVLVVGEARSGARRWLFGIQPSEFSKLATILLLASLYGRPDARRDFFAYLRGLAIVLVPVALIVRQPDLGTAMVFLPTAFMIFFVARLSPRAFWLSLAAGVLGIGFVFGALLAAEKLPLSEKSREGLRAATGLSEYQRKRVLVFMFPERDPHGMAWNKRQSEIAVGSGGVFGKGYLRGDQNILGFLPRSVAPTDFIFSVIAEETGFVGSLGVLMAYLLAILSGLWVALRSEDGVGRLLCVGVVALLFSHVFVNVAMTMGMLPITGLPLPFLSYGGSFMWVMMASVGFVESVAVHSGGRKMGDSPSTLAIGGLR